MNVSTDTLDVLEYVLKYHKQNGEYPVQREIAEGLHISVSRVNNAVRILEGAEVLQLSKRQRRILAVKARTLADAAGMLIRATQEMVRGRLPQQRAGRKPDNFGGL